MDYWGVMFGLGLLATAIGVIAFVRYRERETTSLQRQTALVRELRDLAGSDEVRLAAVDEFSLTVYQRLFYVGVVAPWIRSGAWALLGTVLAGAGALVIGPLDGLFATVAHISTIVLAAVFALAMLVFVGIAGFHAATTPRVSFQDSYADDVDDPAPTTLEVPADSEKKSGVESAAEPTADAKA